MEIIHLSVPAQLPPDGVRNDPGVLLQHIGLHRAAILGGFLNDRHIPDAAHRHIQGARDGGGGQGQHIHIGGQLLDTLLLADAEPLLLVHDEQPQIVKLHIRRQQPVGAHHNIHLAAFQLAHRFRLLLGGAKTGEHLHMHREPLKSLEDGVVVLKRQNGGGHQQGALLPLGNAFKRCPQRHLGLAEAHIAAQQPVHRDGTLHIGFDFINAAQLIFRFGIFEVPFKVVLPFLIGAERIARRRHPLAIQGDELAGNVLDRRAHPGLGFLPFLPAQPMELDGGVLLGANVFAHQIQLGHRHIQGVPLGVFQLDIVLDDSLHLHLVDALIDADAVGGMHYIVAHL